MLKFTIRVRDFGGRLRRLHNFVVVVTSGVVTSGGDMIHMVYIWCRIGEWQG